MSDVLGELIGVARDVAKWMGKFAKTIAGRKASDSALVHLLSGGSETDPKFLALVKKFEAAEVVTAAGLAVKKLKPRSVASRPAAAKKVTAAKKVVAPKEIPITIVRAAATPRKVATTLVREVAAPNKAIPITIVREAATPRKVPISKRAAATIKAK